LSPAQSRGAIFPQLSNMKLPTTLILLVTLSSLALKIETCFSKTFVPHSIFTWHHNPEQQHENPKFVLCVDQQEIVWMNLLHETSFMKLIFSVLYSPVS
jgi:hypothetical protein